jgi:hypothetical protein
LNTITHTIEAGAGLKPLQRIEIATADTTAHKATLPPGGALAAV